MLQLPGYEPTLSQVSLGRVQTLGPRLILIGGLRLTCPHTIGLKRPRSKVTEGQCCLDFF